MSDIIIKLAWPALALLAGLVFFRPLHLSITALATRIVNGAEFKLGGLSVARLPDEKTVTKELVKAAEPSKKPVSENPRIVAEFGDDLLSDANIALYHTSFRRPDKDALFGSAMHQIEVIVLGPEPALDQIESVTYLLARVYAKREYHMEANMRGDRFKLKELANGYSIVRAEIKFKGSQPSLRLNRFIDLMD